MRICIAAILVLTLTLAAHAGENFMPNPGFDVMKDGQPDGWYPIGAKFGDGVLGTDTAVKRSGDRSLLIDFDPAKAEKLQAVQVASSAPTFRGGTTYTFSCYVKTQNAKKAFLILYEYPAPFPPGTQHQSQSIRGDNDWTRLSITFTARPDIGNVQVRCAGTPQQDGKPSKIWFDDLQIEEGDTPTEFEPEWVTEFYGLEAKKPMWFPVPFDYEANAEHKTPHISPAKVDGGPQTPVLFSMWWGRMRVVSELIQRMNIDTTCVAINGRPNRGFTIHEQCALRLREKLADNPRVLVLDADVWNGIVPSDKKRIADRVRDGMGLVFAEIPQGALTDDVKQFIDQCEQVGKGHTYTLGKGKVHLHMSGKPPVSTYQREAKYDALVRSIRAVSDQPAEPMTVSVEPRVPDSESDWTLSVKSDVDAHRLLVRVRPNRHVEGTDLETLTVEQIDLQEAAYARDATVRMAPLPAGMYFAEVVAVDRAGDALAWHLEPFAVDGKLRIWEVRSDEPLLVPGRSTAVRVTVENTDTKPSRIELRGTLRDGVGRLIAEKVSTQALATEGQSDVTLDVAALPAASPIAWLEVQMLADGRVLDSRRLRLCSEPLERPSDFFFGFYMDHPEGSRKLGADVMAGGAASNFGFRSMPWIDVMPYEGSLHLPVTEHNVADPASIAKASDVLKEQLAEIMPHKTVGVIIIDEWHNDYGTSPAELAYFKQFLKQTYGSIDKLNASWQTSYGSFDDVTFELCSEKAIRDGASPIAWADMQACSEQAVAEYVAALQAAAETVDPDVRIGFSGTRDTKADNGLDWHALMQTQKFVATYGGVHTRLEESFRKPGTALSQWSYPTETNFARAMYDPWRDVFRQRQGYLHYSGAFTNMFMPDHRPHPSAKVIEREVEAIRRGPARLINGSRWHDYGIAVLYDTASYRAARIARLQHGANEAIGDILYATDAAINDARLFCKFVAPQHLDEADFRVLYLGYAQAMSDASVAAVRRFVERGGVVIADIRPAVTDERCRPRSVGALNDVFGIAPRSSVALLRGGQFTRGDTTFNVAAGELDMQPTSAVAQAGISQGEASGPALFVHEYGKGRAVLLNCAFPNYKQYRAGGIGGEVGIESADAAANGARDLLASIIADHADIHPLVTVNDAQGHAPRNVWVTNYLDGDLHYLAMLPDRDDWEIMEKFDVKVALAEPKHVYDQRRGEYLGRIDAFDLTLQEAHARLFALLHYQVNAVEVDAPRQVRCGELLNVDARVTISTGEPGRHVFVAELIRPDGTSKRWDRITFERGGGAIPIAFDDPAGPWTLIVTDAATGITSRTTVNVVAP